MALAYSEFDTTVANLLADLKTKILLSSDWSNPTGSVVKATCSNGATMAIDLVGGGAIDAQHISPTFYRLFAGTGPGTDSYQRYCYFTQNIGGSSTSKPLHCKVSASNRALYVEIEGPRSGELQTDNTTYGGLRCYFFVAEVVAYLSGDTATVVAGGGNTSNASAGPVVGAQAVAVARNRADTQPWVPGHLETLTFPDQAYGAWYHRQPLAKDGNEYLSPYVVWEDSDGIRGRVQDIFFAGMNGAQTNTVSDPNPSLGLSPGQSVTYGGNTYKITQCSKSNNSVAAWSSLGAASNNSGAAVNFSPLVAVRTV